MLAILKTFADPVVWVLLLLTAGLLLLRNTGKKKQLKAGYYLFVLGTCIFFFFSLKPVSNSLVYFLEDQYQFPSEKILEKVDIIVILGGGFYPSGGLRKTIEPSGATCSRTVNGIRIFKQSRAKLLVLSGAGEEDNGEGDAEIMKNLAVTLGIPADKIITEQKSRNTFEHVLEFASIFPPTTQIHIGVVTSAIHMPRSVQAFRRKFLKDAIVPIPVGYIYSPIKFRIKYFVPSTEAFSKSCYAMHEWIGIFWYKILGKLW
jgi:uncharacterized SAM-binding protein YcdF (DUF218 family)